jgi:hypothetical protein
MIARGLVAVAAAIAWLVVHRHPPGRAKPPRRPRPGARRPAPERDAVTKRRKPRKTGPGWLRNALFVRKREYYKNIAPDPGSCISRYFCGCGGRSGFFFTRTRHGAGQTPRPKDGENSREDLFSHRDLPSMTDHRVHHLVTDLRSR